MHIPKPFVWLIGLGMLACLAWYVLTLSPLAQ